MKKRYRAKLGNTNAYMEYSLTEEPFVAALKFFKWAKLNATEGDKLLVEYFTSEINNGSWWEEFSSLVKDL